MKRPGNSLSPCRTCHITATRDPSKPRAPLYVPHSGRYDIENLPLRTDLRKQIEYSEIAGDEWMKKFGISRSSILLQLPSVHFPRSFPLDLMHSVLQNTTELLWKLWTGNLNLLDSCTPPAGGVPDYVLPKTVLEEVSDPTPTLLILIMDRLGLQCRVPVGTYLLTLAMLHAILITIGEASRPQNGRRGFFIMVLLYWISALEYVMLTISVC